MTAMFAMFLVLWLVNQSSDVKSAIAGYFQDPLGRADEFGSSIMPGEGQYASTPRVLSERDVLSLRRDRLQRLADDIEEKLTETPQFEEVRKNVDITLTDDGLRIELIEDSSGVFFETGKPDRALTGVRCWRCSAPNWAPCRTSFGSRDIRTLTRSVARRPTRIGSSRQTAPTPLEGS